MTEQAAAPGVGIFWIYRAEIFGVTVPLDQGTITSLGIIDTEIDHATFWESDGAHRARFPDLSGVEYFDVPRGRVLFDTTRRLSMVYLDSRINLPPTRKIIARFFNLTTTRTQWHLDPHYVTK